MTVQVRGRNLLWIIAFAIAFRLAIAPLPSTLSDDAFRYLWDGKMLSHGLNPYMHTPANVTLPELISDPLRGMQKFPEFYTSYLPLSEILFGFASVLSSDWLVSYYILKCIWISLDVGSVFLVLVLLKHWNLPLHSLLLYAWNPLVIIELCGQIHTEAVMVFFFLLSLYYISRNKFAVSSGVFAFAALGKITILLFAPFLFRRIGYKWLVVFFSVFLLVCAPFFDLRILSTYGKDLTKYFTYFEFNGGLFSFCRLLGTWIFQENLIKILGPLLGLIAATFIVILFLRSKDDGKINYILYGMYATMIFLFCSTVVHPWYIILLYTVLPFVPRASSLWWGYFSGWTYITYSLTPYHENKLIMYTGYILLLVIFYYERRHGSLLFIHQEQTHT